MSRLPRPYLVAVDIEPNKSNQLETKLEMQRVGMAATIEDARTVIKNDVKGLSSAAALVGSISPRGRTYHIFKAEWSKVDSVKY